MSKRQNKSSKGSRASSFLYMALWLTCAMAAIAYMSFLVENTDMNLKPFVTVDNSTNQPRTEKLLSDIRDGIGQTNHSLKQLNVKYYGLDSQVTELRRDVEVLAQNNSKLSKKVRRIEAKTNPNLSLKQIDKTEITGSVIPLPKTKNILKNKKKLKEKQTAKQKSKNKKLSKLKKLDRKNNITQTQFAVALGNYQNLPQLKKAWAKLNRKYNNALNSLSPRYITIVVNNQAKYKLVSGPLKNALDAAKICFHLQQSKTYCKQTVYQGSNI